MRSWPYEGRRIARGAPGDVLTPEMLSAIYGVPMTVIKEGAGGRLVTVPELRKQALSPLPNSSNG